MVLLVGAGRDPGAAKMAALAPEVAGLAAAVAAGLVAVGAAVREAAAGGSRIVVEVPGPQRCERLQPRRRWGQRQTRGRR